MIGTDATQRHRPSRSPSDAGSSRCPGHQAVRGVRAAAAWLVPADLPIFLHTIRRQEKANMGYLRVAVERHVQSAEQRS
jgi:hypothetical protein